MPTKTWFIIRDRTTGKHLPCRTGRKASYTSLKLTDERPPRIFSKKGHATQAMACWKAGVLTPKFVKPNPDQSANWGLTGINASFLEGEERTNRYDVHEVAGRDKADLEVVEITIGDYNDEAQS